VGSTRFEQGLFEIPSQLPPSHETGKVRGDIFLQPDQSPKKLRIYYQIVFDYNGRALNIIENSTSESGGDGRKRPLFEKSGAKTSTPLASGCVGDNADGPA
jgi:hypothetical protein